MSTAERFVLGIDFGSQSARAVLVAMPACDLTASGRAPYPSGSNGVISPPGDPEAARQEPDDYLIAMELAVRACLERAGKTLQSFTPEHVAAIGISATGSTPIPVDAHCNPVSRDPRFADRPDALAWMWKDHSSHVEAETITRRVDDMGLPYLRASGGRYSSEWFWAKLLKCARSSPDIMSAADSWLELQDFIPAILTGVSNPHLAVRGSCAAGHKGMYSADWGGWPAAVFLSDLHPELARVRSTLADKLTDSDRPAGVLTGTWAEKLGLPEGISVAAGSLDAHAAAFAAGACPGTLVRILGTSACDITITERPAIEIDAAGLCGVARSSVLPGLTGIEAGQAAVGDLFDWGARALKSDTADRDAAISELMKEAGCWQPGETGLLALDWNNGNRSPLMDSRLSGLILGLTLATPPSAIFRALVEATGFGFRKILETIESRTGQSIDEIVLTGGIAERNAELIRLYADLLQRPIRISPLQDASAVGAACYAAASTSLFGTAREIAAAMGGADAITVQPAQEDRETYQSLYALYSTLHSAFSLNAFAPEAIGRLMKDLMNIRDRALRQRFATRELVNS